MTSPLASASAHVDAVVIGTGVAGLAGALLSGRRAAQKIIDGFARGKNSV